jgi:hypothetical protein
VAKRSHTNSPYRSKSKNKKRLRGWDRYEPFPPTSSHAAEDHWKLEYGENITRVYPMHFREDWCGVDWHGWGCTRAKGHVGPHVAHSSSGHPAYAIWGTYKLKTWKTILVALRMGVPVEVKSEN